MLSMPALSPARTRGAGRGTISGNIVLNDGGIGTERVAGTNSADGAFRTSSKTAFSCKP
jgi:hypothetical protein